MKLGRRGVVIGSAAMAASCRVREPAVPPLRAQLESVLDAALGAATKGGATYADARIVRRRREHLATREDHVSEVGYMESYGVGVRVLAYGAWGFAASPTVSPEAAAGAADKALAIARANAGSRERPLSLAPVATYRDGWSTRVGVDPLSVPLADKADLLKSIWEAARGGTVAFCNGFSEVLVEDKTFASTAGSLITQSITRVGAGYKLTATNAATGLAVTRAHELPPRQAGWEYIAESSLLADAKTMADDARRKLAAPTVVAGRRDLVLAPSNLWLTLHESVGHPTELDRALGYEANFAGTSFATPDKLGTLQYAAPLITVYADKTTQGGLATAGYDDDGEQTQRWNLIKDGLFVGYQTTREQAGWLGQSRSRGCAYAEDYRSVAFQRMPNVSLAPGNEARSIGDLVAATDDGILITGDGSWSIDHQRYNFQFGGQMFYEIKSGKITGVLRDVAYQSSSVEFWRSCDLIGGHASFELHGALNDGKGEPVQSNAVSHGCPPARFRDVSVISTRSSAA